MKCSSMEVDNTADLLRTPPGSQEIRSFVCPEWENWIELSRTTSYHRDSNVKSMFEFPPLPKEVKIAEEKQHMDIPDKYVKQRPLSPKLDGKSTPTVASLEEFLI